MKITHSDCNTSLKFQWTCVTNNSSSSSRNGSSNNHRADRSASSISGSSSSSIASNGHNQHRNQELYPRSRFHHATCLQGRYLYVFGGKDRYSPLKDMWRFDTVSQEWEQIEETEAALPHLQGHTMLAHKSQLLIFGGTFYDTNEDTPLWLYNTELHLMRKFSPEPGSVHPVGRREHSAVIFKNSMYMYGGFLDNSGSTDEFWAFNIEEEEWRLIRRHKPGKRHGHIAVVMDSYMWIHGGMRELTALSDLWTFHFAMSTWSKVKGLGTCPTLSGHTAHMVGDCLLLFGGSRGGEPSQDVWTFRVDTLTWRHIATQNGDVYPPISLHTSVLLSASSLRDTSTNHTKSVPQLKGKSSAIDQQQVRPWTSPAANASEDSFHTVGFKTSGDVNILNLETIGTSLDRNNNKSEEDIHGGSETETSFCFTKSNVLTGQNLSDVCSGASSQRSHIVAKDNNDQSSNIERPGNDSQVVARHAGTVARIRPASFEHTGDSIPLLQRFFSVTSDVSDLGENNLTMTLSDENVMKPAACDRLNDASVVSDCLYNNGNFGAGHSGKQLSIGQHKTVGACDSVCESLDHFQKIDVENHTMWESSFSKYLLRDPRNESDCDSLWTGKTDNVKERSRSATCGSLANSHSQRELSKVQFENPLYNKICNSQAKDVTNPCAFKRQSFPNLAQESSVRAWVSFSSSSEWAGQENIPPKSKCDDDLIVEDIELTDLGQLIHNTPISYPSTFSLKWSSLKDLYSKSTDALEHPSSDYTCTSPLQSQRKQTKSLGSLASCQTIESSDGQFLSGGVLTSRDSADNILAAAGRELSLSHGKREKSGNVPGKYIKNVGTGGGRNFAYLQRSRGNIAKLAESSQHSVATQTGGSQSSLHVTSNTATRKTSYEHFTATAVSQEHETSLSVSKNSTCAAARESILGDAQLCVLVVGGQTESHSFQKEVLKMWRCHLY